MIYVSIGLGLLFFSIGFIITPNNAKYILSGYNTMSTEDQERFPIKEYLKSFKTFHIWFGTLYTALSVVFHLIDSDWVGYHLGITPIVAYGWFLWTSRRFNRGLSKDTNNNTTLGLIILSLTFAFVVGLFLWSDRESTWSYKNGELSVEGPYSITLNVSELDSVALLDELPEITYRSHGISTGKVAKGKYKGPGNARYHLLIDKPAGEILTLYPKKGIPVLISLEGLDERELFTQILADSYSKE